MAGDSEVINLADNIENIEDADNNLKQTTSVWEHDEELTPHLHWKTYCAVLGVGLIYFALACNVVGAGAYARPIALSVGGADEAPWLVGIIAIETAVLGPPFSQAADYFGRRWFLIIPTLFGAVGSIIVSRATSMGMVIGGMLVLSVQYGNQPLLHAVVSEVLTHRQRGAAQATVNITGALGGILGVVAGAALTSNDTINGFRAIWYLCAGLYAAAAAFVAIAYHPPLRRFQTEFTLRQKLGKLDWVGYSLLTFGVVPFFMGLTWAENPYPWNDAHVLAPLLVGFAFSAVFIIYEWKFKKDGLIHHRLFSRDRNFALALLGVFTEGCVFFATIAFFTYQVSVLYYTNIIVASLPFTVGFCVYAIAPFGAAWYCYKYKRLRALTIVAFLFFLLFNVCMATTNQGSRNAVWGYAVLFGAGLGIVLCSLLVAAQLSAPGDLIATASGLMISARSLGGAIGLAIYTAIFNSKLSSTLASGIANAVLPLGLPPSSLPLLIGALATGDTNALSSIPGISPPIIEIAFASLKQSFADSFRGVWIASAAFSAVGIVGAFFLRDPVQDFNNKIDAPVEKKESIYNVNVK